jgi:hypothetical protein
MWHESVTNNGAVERPRPTYIDSRIKTETTVLTSVCMPVSNSKPKMCGRKVEPCEEEIWLQHVNCVISLMMELCGVKNLSFRTLEDCLLPDSTDLGSGTAPASGPHSATDYPCGLREIIHLSESQFLSLLKVDNDTSLARLLWHIEVLNLKWLTHWFVKINFLLLLKSLIRLFVHLFYSFI